jgi:hypothetical protein
MELWWHSLNLPLQLFYGTGLVAAFALGIEVIFTLLGINHHDLPETTLDHPDQIGMLSIRTITGFFFGFGWAGVIAIKSGLGLPASILVACVVGAAFLFGIYLLMRALFSLHASGTLNYQNAVGQIATVYVTVPPNRGGGGQVEVLIQGRLQTISCVTSHSSALAPQTKVKVTGLVGQGTLEVEPLSSHTL